MCIMLYSRLSWFFEGFPSQKQIFKGSERHCIELTMCYDKMSRNITTGNVYLKSSITTWNLTRAPPIRGMILSLTKNPRITKFF